MKRPSHSKRANEGLDGAGRIAAYARSQPPAIRTMCNLLRELIDAALPTATSKVWHGSPVWFVDENPVVGCCATAKSASSSGTERHSTSPVSSRSASTTRGRPCSMIPLRSTPKVIRRWLDKAKSNVFDSKAFFKKLRQRK